MSTKSKYRNTFLFALIICALFSVYFNQTSVLASSQKADKGTLSVGVPTDRCPIFYVDKNDKITGIGVDLLTVAAQESGYKVEFKAIKEPTLKDALDSKDYDIIMPFGSAIASSKGKATIVSDNLMQTPFTLVTTGNTNLPPLDQISVGMLKSMGGAGETITSLYPGVKISFYDTMGDSVKALRNGKVDALINNSYVWSYYLQKPSYAKLTVHPSSMFSMDFRVGALDTPKGREIIDNINKGIAGIPDTKRSAIILDYTTRRLYHYDFFDFMYQYGLVVIILSIIIAGATYERTKLARANKLAHEASEAKTMFLANMSHEIRTPLNSIIGMSEMISRESTDKKTLQRVYSINSSANSLLCLVNDILDFSRMEEGKLKLRNDPYHLSNLLTDVNIMIRPRAESKGLDYDVKVDSKIPNVLKGDEARLKQVIINLLTNGVKYTMEGFVHLDVRFEVADNNYIKLKFTVKDSGEGMKKEELNRLFKAFERLDEDKNRTIEGTGLGMSIVKQILDAMDSTLHVESEYGVGSELSFVIKQKVLEWAPIGDYESTAEEVVAETSNYCPKFIAPEARILVVDDTELNLTVMKGLLEQTRMQVETALSGMQALDMMSETDYDILLIDHRMPQMDGLELLRRIRSDRSNPNHNKTCIALTANVVDGEREICMEVGFDEFLEKPVNGIKLEETLVKYIPEDKLFDEENETVLPEVDRDKKAEIISVINRLTDEGRINIKEGVEYTGTMEMYINTLRFFRDTVDSNAKTINTFYEEHNLTDYTSKVHALKSSSKIIGAHELSEKSRLLEQAGKNEDLEYIRENHEDMMNLYVLYNTLLADI